MTPPNVPATRFAARLPLVVAFLLLSVRPACPQAESAESAPESAATSRAGKEKPRRGIPVESPLVVARCGVCHEPDAKRHLSRISFMRKSPEGWQQTVKRMIRLHGATLAPDEARDVVRYLSNQHGLARAEAKDAFYEAERRVHWTEAGAGKDLVETCAKCHSLGRILAERRDAEEWKLLKATHVAFFPLVTFQAFGEARRFRGFDEESGEGEGAGAEEPSEEEQARRRAEAENRPDRADRVMGELGRLYPLFTPAWEAWRVNRRPVPLAGEWLVTGRQPGRGRFHGSMVVTGGEGDVFETTTSISFTDGTTVRRKGKGLLYAGYSWRGRSERIEGPPREPAAVKEVVLLSEDWSRFEGRWFAGDYHEFGADVELHRAGLGLRLLAVEPRALRTGSMGLAVTLRGDGFPASIEPPALSFGDGVTVRAIEARDSRTAVARVDVAADARNGIRDVALLGALAPGRAVVFDRIDAIRIIPEKGLARVGGIRAPRQSETFEARAMHRGPDDRPMTADDFEIDAVAARWGLAEFPVREDDDDVQFVGSIDPATGLFTPASDGPNPARRHQANNVGDVFVTAEVPVEGRAEPLRARAHLLVTVPVYTRWDLLETE